MLYIALVVFAGCVVALQPPINAALGRTVGLLESGLVFFCRGHAVSGCGRAALRAWQRAARDGSSCLAAGWWRAGRIYGGGHHHGRAAHWSAEHPGGHDFGNLVMAAIIDHKGWFGLTAATL